MKVKFFCLLISLVFFGGVLWNFWSKGSGKKVGPSPPSSSLATPVTTPQTKSSNGFGAFVKKTSPPAEKGDDYILIKKGKGLSSLVLNLVYRGVLEKQNGDEWTISADGEKTLFKIIPQTKFAKPSSDWKLQEIKKESIKLGDALRVTVKVSDIEDFQSEIERGDLRNQDALSVVLSKD